MEDILLTGTRLKLLKDKKWQRKNWDDNNPEKEAVGLKRVLQRERERSGGGVKKALVILRGQWQKKRKKKKVLFGSSSNLKHPAAQKHLKGQRCRQQGDVCHHQPPLPPQRSSVVNSILRNLSGNFKQIQLKRNLLFYQRDESAVQF